MLRSFASKLGFAISFSISISISSTSAFAADVPFQPLQSVRQAAPHLVDEGGVWVLGLGSLALFGARDLDEDMQEHFAYKSRLGGYESLGNEVFGRGIPGLLLGAGLWGYGAKTDDARTIHAGQASIEAIASTSLVVTVLKGGVNRLRPDSSDRFSFPSGHTSTVFASAGVLHEFYGWKVGAVADALGVLTSLSRVTANRHWFSDTVGGGLIGFAVGRAIARGHREALGELQSSNKQQASFTYVPMLDIDLVGLGIVASF